MSQDEKETRRRLSRRQFLKGAAVGLSLPILAACVPATTAPGASGPAGAAAPAGAATPAAGAAAPAAPAAAAAAGATTVTFWQFDTSELSINSWKSAISAFEQQTPTIHVNMEIVPWADQHQKLVTAVATGGLPDTSMLGNNVVAEFHALNALAPMDDYFAQWSSETGTDITKGIWPGDELYYHLDGHWWGSPIAEETRCLYYRKDLFTAAGLDPAKPPATWDDARTYAQKLTKEGQWGFGIPGGIKYATVQTFMSVYLGYGAKFLNNGKCGFDTPEFRQALTYYTDLYTKDKVTPPDTPTYDNTQLEPLFEQGKLAMYIDGPWLYRMMQADKVAFLDQVAVAQVPAGPKGAFGFLGGWPLVLWDASQHKNETFKWIRFATDPKGNLAPLCKALGQLPGSKSAVDQDPWTTPPLDVFSKQLGFAYPYQYPDQEIKQMGTLEVDAIQTPVQEVMLGKKSVDQATKDMVAHIDQVLSA